LNLRKGLTKKLDYEKAKFKAKAAKPDYHDGFAEEGEKFDHGRSPPKHLNLSDVAKGDFSKIWRDDKLKAIKVYERHLRGLRLKVGTWTFKFNFTPDQFAKENGISVQEAKKMLPSVKADAVERMRLTVRRALSVSWDGRRLKFRTFLPTVELIQWSKVYKRVELRPMEHEIDENGA